MLFNSYQFIFIFLIPVVSIYLLIDKKYKIDFLIISSIIFYGLWSIEHLTILLLSILINYIFALKIERDTSSKINLIVIICINLLPLIFYKYSSSNLILPLAISFFTFQQIAFQVDIYKKKEKITSFREYLFFILFFPQLVAGPIVHYGELIPQIKSKDWGRYREEYFNMGISLFSIGLFKKVVLADSLAPIANQAFNNISTLSNYNAWEGLLAYTFQIYFDFSGYSDMAIGLALFFGIKLPINFYSPYKSKNIIEFWRLWHITLSNFLKEYIYIPLGGNRVSLLKQVRNIIITMTIGGIWHGAGFTFFIWGFIHGIYIVISHLIIKWIKISIPKIISIFITFTFISLLWVLFRANSIDNAIIYYRILFQFKLHTIEIDLDTFLITFSMFIVWFFPNSIEISKYANNKSKLKWYYAFFASILFFISLKVLAMSPAKTFVYFNF